MTAAIYDTIGRSYDRTRRADPRILEQVVVHLGLRPGSTILDVGCGSGNYTIALHDRGFQVVGIDISEHMLGLARGKRGEIAWQHGDARRLPHADGAFDGLVSILVTHHLPDLDAALAQMWRVVKPGGRVVLFTSTPLQMRSFWLNHYLPSVVAVSERAMLDYDLLAAKLTATGFWNVRRTTYFVDDSLEDWFLQCGKYRPELYLDPVVRAGISTFALSEGSEALEPGLRALASDIESGAVERVIRSWDNECGDFLFVAADKRPNDEEAA